MVTVRCLLADCLLTVDSGIKLLFICTLNLLFFNSPTLFLKSPVMNFPLGGFASVKMSTCTFFCFCCFLLLLFFIFFYFSDLYFVPFTSIPIAS